jgi:putative transposase
MPPGFFRRERHHNLNEMLAAGIDTLTNNGPAHVLV